MIRSVSSHGTENRRKGRYAAWSSNSLGSRSGRGCPCRTDPLRANSYRPSTLTWSSSSGESLSTLLNELASTRPGEVRRDPGP